MRLMWPFNRLSSATAARRRWLRRVRRKLTSLHFGHQLGMVITEQSVRMCLVRQVLHHQRVIDTAVFPLDPHEAASWEGKIDAAINAATGYLGEHGLQRIPVNVGLVGDDIAFRRLYLPRMSKKERSTAILWEGQKLFPFELDQCLVYHEIAETGTQGEYEQTGINLVAVKREIIEALYGRLESAGFKTGYVDFLPSVIADAFPVLDPGDDDKHRLFLFLGDDQSLALFVHRGRLEFFQQFLTNPISADDDDRMMNAPAVAAELTTFLDLFNGQRFGNAVDGLVLGGKYAADPDAAAAFSGAAGLPCRRLFDTEKALSAIKSVGTGQAREMLDVIATALAGIGKHPLIPDAAWQKILRRKAIFRLAAVLVLTLMLIVNLHSQWQLRNNRLRTELVSLRAASQAYENSAAYRGYLGIMGELSRQQARQERLHDRYASHFHLMLKELSRTIPDDISLTNLYFSRENGVFILRLEGVVSLSGFSPEIVLAQYVETLDKSPFFVNVNVRRHLKKSDGGRFELTFMLEMGALV